MAIYFIQDKNTGAIKIGKSRHVWARLSGLRRQLAKPLRLLGIIDGYTNHERELHNHFSGSNITGEWFEPTQELMHFISCNCKQPPSLSKPSPNWLDVEEKTCKGLTRSGRPCAMVRAKGSRFCWHHKDQDEYTRRKS